MLQILVKKRTRKIEYEFLHEIPEDIFTDESAVYIEIIEDNYHYAPILGFAIANENGIIIYLLILQ